MPSTHITADPGRTDLTIRLNSEAPRELVFRAFVDPVLYVRWQRPRRLTTCREIEPLSGGSYRRAQTDLDGSLHAFHGVYHEISESERIISTLAYDGPPERSHVVLDAASFDACPEGGSVQSYARPFCPRTIGMGCGTLVGERDGPRCTSSWTGCAAN